MKAIIKGLGIAVLTAMLVFLLAGCKEPDDSSVTSSAAGGESAPIESSSENIVTAEIVITPPVKGMVPSTTASGTGYFTIGLVSWSPTDDTFLGGNVYTASVALTANEGYTFAELTSATINGQDAEVINNTESVVTLSYTFPPTNEKTVFEIAVKTQPNLTYTHGDMLSLTGLVVTLTYDDTTKEDVTAENFTDKNITTNIIDGYNLSYSTHNEQSVMIIYGDLTCNTDKLTVNKKTIDISDIQGVVAPITGGTPVTVITGNDQYSGTVTWNGNPSAFAAATQYTATITLTPKTDYTLQGVTSDFFTVEGAATVSNSDDSGTITAVFPQTAAITIKSPEIIIDAPVKGMSPDTTASSEADSFTPGAVSWSPTDNPFRGGIVYTATVTLTASHGFTFNGLTTPTINGQTADVLSNTGATVTLSYTFPATNEKTVSKIAIKTQPNNLTYTHGDMLNLTGLVVTLTYDDTTTEDVTAGNLTAKNITTNPSQGNHLIHSIDNGNPVTVSYGNLTCNTANLTVNKKTINISDIHGVVAPVTGGIPVTVITENDQYSGTVTWSGNPSAFAPVTQYTATITLTPKTEYTLQGVTSNFFTVAGVTTVSNSANSGVITAVFPQTAAIMINIAAIQGVTAPVRGATPVTVITENDQYSGTVSWNDNPSAFAAATQYTATITLTPKQGYTFTGVSSDFFTVAGATNVSNSADSGTVTAVFPQTAAIVINIAAIQGITAPVTEGIRVSSITQTDQYTGTVVWKNAAGTTLTSSFFEALTQYTATITLTPKQGYTLTGISSDFFTVAGAVTVSNAADSGIITAVFPQTAIGNFTTVPTLTLTAASVSLNYSRSISTPTADTYDLYWKAGKGLTADEVKTTGTKISNISLSGSITGLISGMSYSALITANKTNYNSVDSAVKTEMTTPQTFTTVAALENWLKNQPDNTAATAYRIKLNVADIASPTDLRTVLKNYNNKYVYLDLSGSTFTSIGTAAFDACFNLTGITIPNTVTSVSSDSFLLCMNLASITIGSQINNVSWLVNGLFYHLTDINVDNASLYFSSDNGVLYNRTKTQLIRYPQEKKDASFAIPGTVTSINNSAFYNCENLISVTMPNSVNTAIGSGTFQNCKNLTTITLSNNIPSIGGSAFAGCTSLPGIIIPNSVTSIGTRVFANCTSLASVTLPTNPNFTTIDKGTFYGCTSLTGIIIPDSVTSIAGATGTSDSERGAFQGCTGLLSVTIGNKVTSIGGYAFNGCTNLTNITIPNSVTSIGNNAFQNCTELLSLTIGNKVAIIEGVAFAGCAKLNNITIPNSVTNIYASAFRDCTNLTRIIFEGSGVNINSVTPFPGDLRTKYMASGAGTYTRPSGSETWTKQ
jgi:hypothetical protein